MTISTLLIAISLGLDLFAGGLAVGVAGLPRPRWTSTAVIFAAFGVTLLALGLLVGNLLSDGIGDLASYFAGIALIALGMRTLIGLILTDHSSDEEPDLAPRSVAMTGLVASVDKLAVGISLSLIDLSVPYTLLYFAVQGFILTMLGLALGQRIGARLGVLAHLLAGGVLVLLGVIIIVQTARHHALP
jgi:putative Mn2+ efflux pump MntP